MKFPASVTELLRDLVAIPSVSPEGDSGGTTPGEAAMGAQVAALLRALGAEVTVTDVQPGRPNVVGRFASGRADAPTLALVPHLDTVGVAGMTVAPFAPEIRDGRLHGRGACDTKGPMAAALWAIHDWRRTVPAPRLNLIFAATMGEEELSTGARALCAGGFRADFAIALEPTDLKFVHAAKGVLRVWVDAAGRAAHGATPERGRNAVFATLPFLAACRDQLAPRFAGTVHPDLGPASLNVGIVRGGQELNVVPDRCRVGLDIRTHPTLDNDTALTAVRDAAPGLDVAVHRTGPPFVVAPAHPWLQRLAPHARGCMSVPWFSDANIFNAHGIPAVAFGPGSIAQAHTIDEFIEVAALEEGARAFGAILRAAGGE
ncbi:MAG: M20/M25/M40 family metallo-hydrolase [Verrucomicrobia bacterium]|nr:M20/M25/M40 family metallo-hydrolase [Verrucomicrobiota bacterium]